MLSKIIISMMHDKRGMLVASWKKQTGGVWSHPWIWLGFGHSMRLWEQTKSIGPPISNYQPNLVLLCLYLFLIYVHESIIIINIFIKILSIWYDQIYNIICIHHSHNLIIPPLKLFITCEFIFFFFFSYFFLLHMV